MRNDSSRDPPTENYQSGLGLDHLKTTYTYLSCLADLHICGFDKLKVDLTAVFCLKALETVFILQLGAVKVEMQLLLDGLG